MSWYGDAFSFAADPGGFFEDDPSFAANQASQPLRDKQGRMSNAFGRYGEQQFQGLTREGLAQRDMLRRQAMGQDSLSALQLRQGLQQNLAQQQAIAAGARPNNAAMAARQAAMNAGRAASGLSGQQAMAGLAERQAANAQLGQMISQERGQNLQAALGARQNAINAYAPLPTGESGKDKMLGAGGGVLGAIFSDKRLKTSIKDGKRDAEDFIKGLKAYSYSYKNEEHGKGKQLGVMAQDLERTSAGRQAVFDTPQGKKVDGAKLAGAIAAALPTLHERLSKLEGKGK